MIIMKDNTNISSLSVTNKMIEVKDIKKNYVIKKGWFHPKKKVVEAVKGVSFDVNSGEIFGLLGENGAGKTTIIKMMITLLAPTEGECKVLGLNTIGDEKKIRSNINFIFGGELGVYRRLSAKDNLLYFAGLYKVKYKNIDNKIDELLRLVELYDVKDQLVETYSKGMIQRLQIAKGLINDPQVIFMDEPTIGLDPIGARDLRRLIVKLKENGKTVVITTHYLYEADELCDRIAIVHKGELLELDSPKNLKEKYSHGEREVSLEDVYIKIIS